MGSVARYTFRQMVGIILHVRDLTERLLAGVLVDKEHEVSRIRIDVATCTL
jgi:hypothetical protein